MAAHRAAELSALLRADRTGQSWVVSDGGPLADGGVQHSVLRRCVTATRGRGVDDASDSVVWCQDDFPWRPDPQRDGSTLAPNPSRYCDDLYRAPELPVLAVGGSFDERVETVE